jgi:hypothetical protein
VQHCHVKYDTQLVPKEVSGESQVHWAEGQKGPQVPWVQSKKVLVPTHSGPNHFFLCLSPESSFLLIWELTIPGGLISLVSSSRLNSAPPTGLYSENGAFE